MAESGLTVVNCFAKAEISKKQQNTALEHSDKPVKKMDKLAVRAPNFSPDGITADCVTDNNVLSTQPLLTVDKIIDIIMGKKIVHDAMNDLY